MAPRELGGRDTPLSSRMVYDDRTGVVDSSLRVYGTRNLRVVDASIIPLELAMHIQATVYAIAEKAGQMCSLIFLSDTCSRLL